MSGRTCSFMYLVHALLVAFGHTVEYNKRYNVDKINR